MFGLRDLPGIMPWAPLFAEKTGTGPEGGATVPTDCAAEPTGFSCGPEL